MTFRMDYYFYDSGGNVKQNKIKGKLSDKNNEFILVYKEGKYNVFVSDYEDVISFLHQLRDNNKISIGAYNLILNHLVLINKFKVSGKLSHSSKFLDYLVFKVEKLNTKHISSQNDHDKLIMLLKDLIPPPLL